MATTYRNWDWDFVHKRFSKNEASCNVRINAKSRSAFARPLRENECLNTVSQLKSCSQDTSYKLFARKIIKRWNILISLFFSAVLLHFRIYMFQFHYKWTSTRHHLTWDKSLFMGICDTEQSAVLLLAAGVSLGPCQHRLLVNLVIRPSCKVSLPVVRR